MPKLKSIVFDLDDTLYSERDYVRSGFGAVSEWLEESLGVPAERAFRELHGLFEEGVRGDIFDRWLGDNGATPADHVPTMVRLYREHVPTLRLRPGVEALLPALRERYSLGLVTDGVGAVQRIKVAALDLEAALDAMIFSDDGGRDRWKPDPWPFRQVLDALGGHPPDAAVYVADNPAKDFLGARRAGMWSIRLRARDGLHAPVEPVSDRHAPDLEISELDELQTALNDLEAK